MTYQSLITAAVVKRYLLLNILVTIELKWGGGGGGGGDYEKYAIIR